MPFKHHHRNVPITDRVLKTVHVWPSQGGAVEEAWKDKKPDVLRDQLHFKTSNPCTWSKQPFHILTTEFLTSKKIPQKTIKSYFKGCNKHIIDPLFMPLISYMSINLLLCFKKTLDYLKAKTPGDLQTNNTSERSTWPLGDRPVSGWGDREEGTEEMGREPHLAKGSRPTT